MTRLVLSRVLPGRSLQRIREAVPGIDIVADERAMLPAAGRVGLLYRANERTQAYPEAPEQLTRRWIDLLAEADILFDLHPAAMDLVANNAPHLKWIQGIASGAGEAFNHPGIRDSQIQITTARGVHDGPLADFAMASFLAHAKRFDHLQELANTRSWNEFPGRRVSGARLVIVGYGSIGQAIARRARSFDMIVTGIRTTSHTDHSGVPVLGMESLDGALADADYVAIALPATPSTENLFTQARFAAMKPGAYLVNVGRGSVIDEAAMIQALTAGTLAGSSIDVAANEPLPVTDPLWDAPNLRISPHCTSLIPGDAMDRIVEILIENLLRHQSGVPLINVATRPAAVSVPQ